MSKIDKMIAIRGNEGGSDGSDDCDHTDGSCGK